MKKSVIAATALVALSGCVQPIEITQEPVSAALTSSALQDRLAPNTSKMVVRAYLPKTDTTERSEVSGARCTIVSDELRATVITPQEVILPRFKQRSELQDRGVPGSMAITCTAGGKSGSTLITASPKQVSTALNAGIAGAILTTAVTAAMAASTPWEFPVAVGVTLTE